MATEPTNPEEPKGVAGPVDARRLHGGLSSAEEAPPSAGDAVTLDEFARLEHKLLDDEDGDEPAGQEKAGILRCFEGDLDMTNNSSDTSSVAPAATVTNLDVARASKLEAKQDLASQLLQPNPEALNTNAEQIAVFVVTKLDPSMFFRTHPELRLTLKLVTPGRDSFDNYEYAVLREAEPLLLRHKLAPYLATLYPVVVNTQPLTYRLMRVKHPANGRRWDNWNLTRKLALDKAVGEWIALRSIQGGYEWVIPHPDAIFPEPVFPDWDANEWLERSFGAQDLVLGGDENHPVFKSLSGL